MSNFSVILNISHSGNLSGTNASALDSFYFYKKEQLAFLCVLFLLILVCNTTVLILIFRTWKRRSRMNIFIANLASADLMVGIFYVLVDIMEKITVEWYAGTVLCKSIRFIQAISAYGSTYALVALSIDRLDSIARPLKSISKGKRIKTLIILQWLCAVLFSLPMFLFDTTVWENKKSCIMNLPAPWVWKLYFTMVTFAVFIIPAIIIAFCYIIIVIIIWGKSSFSGTGNKQPDVSVCTGDQRKMTSNNSSCLATHDNMEKTNCNEFASTTGKYYTCVSAAGTSSSRGVIPKAKIKTIKMTFVIILAFIFCWSPYFVYDLNQVFGKISRTQETVAITTFIQSLAPLNSAGNPIIFLIFNYKTYQGLCCKRGCNSPISSVTRV